MTEIKVSQLPEASEINDSDLLMIVQSGTNKKITKANARFASGDEISIGTTQPVEDEKLWIKSDETTDQARYKDGNTWKELSIKALDSMVIGSIIQFVGTTIPNGWLECDGSTITQSAYPELYDLIGGTLPDFRGRVLVGQDTNDTDFDTLLETGGSKELQRHNHFMNKNAGLGTESAWGIPAEYNSNMGDVYTGEAGTGDSGNLQPYAVVKHIIKAKNTTPTMASVVNAKSNSTVDTYSCDYINKLSTYPSTSEGEIVIGQTSDGTPVYRKTIYITQQNQAHGIDNLFAVISTNAILNNFDYGWNNVSYDVIVQSNNVWLRDRALNNVSNGILLTIEYYKTTN